MLLFPVSFPFCAIYIEYVLCAMQHMKLFDEPTTVRASDQRVVPVGGCNDAPIASYIAIYVYVGG